MALKKPNSRMLVSGLLAGWLRSLMSHPPAVPTAMMSGSSPILCEVALFCWTKTSPGPLGHLALMEEKTSFSIFYLHTSLITSTIVVTIVPAALFLLFLRASTCLVNGKIPILRQSTGCGPCPCAVARRVPRTSPSLRASCAALCSSAGLDPQPSSTSGPAP